MCVTQNDGALASPLPALDDPEGEAVPEGLARDAGAAGIVDAHVHLFPDRLFAAIRRWFDRHGWPIRYRLTAREVLGFLFARGVSAAVGLTYAHKPGMARALNAFMAELAREEPRLIALGTVLPGEPEAVAILEEAAALGLRGLKLHCHVQCFAPDAPEVAPLYDFCARRGWPIVLHAGREPKSPAYACDPHALCAVERVEAVLREHPRLRLCIPHLGYDEEAAYAALLERTDQLWLDTTMALAGYLPRPRRSGEVPLARLLAIRPDRVLYGSDFPGLPYAWDRELRRIEAAPLDAAQRAALVGGNARALFGAA